MTGTGCDPSARRSSCCCVLLGVPHSTVCSDCLVVPPYFQCRPRRTRTGFHRRFAILARPNSSAADAYLLLGRERWKAQKVSDGFCGGLGAPTHHMEYGLASGTRGSSAYCSSRSVQYRAVPSKQASSHRATSPGTASSLIRCHANCHPPSCSVAQSNKHAATPYEPSVSQRVCPAILWPSAEPGACPVDQVERFSAFTVHRRDRAAKEVSHRMGLGGSAERPSNTIMDTRRVNSALS